MGATRRSEWICLRCRKTNPPADGNISDEDEEEETGQDVGKMLKEMAKKWDGFEKKVRIDEWHQTINNDVLSLLHVNIKTVRAHWDLLCIKIQHVMSTLDFLILTEVNVREEEAMAYQLRNFKQTPKIKS
ncbi:hypothetical protein M8J76_011622 [Diaphorina citri]|nr:hypothetical protein M8J76_011622 [Diaphorina citri]